MTAASIVLTVLGVALTAFSLWERLGRGVNARAWVDSPSDKALSMALMLRPGLGLVLLSLGLIIPLGDVVVLGLLVALLGPIGLVMVFWAILEVPLPRWWVPGFARGRFDRQREQKKGARS